MVQFYLKMVTRVIFLDVDGVLHPLNPKGHPLHAEFGALLRRADQESEHEDDLGVGNENNLCAHLRPT